MKIFLLSPAALKGLQGAESVKDLRERGSLWKMLLNKGYSKLSALNTFI